MLNAVRVFEGQEFGQGKLYTLLEGTLIKKKRSQKLRTLRAWQPTI